LAFGIDVEFTFGFTGVIYIEDLTSETSD
jgi:hypothetical protein